MISCPINSVFLGNFKCGYTFNSMKQSTDTAWLGRSIVVLVVKPDLQQHTDGTFGSTGLSLEDQEVKVKVKGCVFSKYEKCPGASRRWSEGGVTRKILEIPWGCLICLWGMLASAGWAPSCPTRSIHGFSCSVSFIQGQLYSVPPPSILLLFQGSYDHTHTLWSGRVWRNPGASFWAVSSSRSHRKHYFLQWHCLRAGCLRCSVQGFCWGDFIITKLIHRNPLHSNTLTMKNQKEELKKKPHSPSQQIV